MKRYLFFLEKKEKSLNESVRILIDIYIKSKEDLEILNLRNYVETKIDQINDLVEKHDFTNNDSICSQLDADQEKDSGYYQLESTKNFRAIVAKIGKKYSKTKSHKFTSEDQKELLTKISALNTFFEKKLINVKNTEYLREAISLIKEIADRKGLLENEFECTIQLLKEIYFSYIKNTSFLGKNYSYSVQRLLSASYELEPKKKTQMQSFLQEIEKEFGTNDLVSKTKKEHLSDTLYFELEGILVENASQNNPSPQFGTAAHLPYNQEKNEQQYINQQENNNQQEIKKPLTNFFSQFSVTAHLHYKQKKTEQQYIDQQENNNQQEIEKPLSKKKTQSGFFLTFGFCCKR